MPAWDAAAEAYVSQVDTEHNAYSITPVVVTICLLWYTFIATVCSIGYVQLYVYVQVILYVHVIDEYVDGDTTRVPLRLHSQATKHRT